MDWTPALLTRLLRCRTVLLAGAGGGFDVYGGLPLGVFLAARGVRVHYANLSFVEADATNLPVADDDFDAVTMSYGLRNVQQPKKALAELFRVTKPGGRLVINEFSTPPGALFGAAYRFYNAQVLPRVARVAGTNGEAYDYLNESIRDWPDQRTLASWIREAGWIDVAYRNLSFGIVALHRARKPE